MRIFTFALLLTSACLAQNNGGSILGTVTDPAGAVVAGAKVRATQIETGAMHPAESNADGLYQFPSLPVGSYTVEAEAAGFKKSIQSGIVLDVNRNARVDLALQVGATNESITVTGDAPLVNTRDVQIGGLVDQRRVNDLPLNGRNVYDLASTLPGVTASRIPTVQDNDGNTLTVNGSRSRNSTFLLDGAFNNDLWRNTGNASPNPEAVEQFRLITSNFSAEFGRSPGAVVNVVTKSGTNQLHGSLYEFLRNDKLNARNFFQSTVSPLRQNQYGASVGGPVLRNRTFFFFAWQGLKIHTNAFINSALPPTAAERMGDFSAAPASQRPKDPDTGIAFPGGKIPAGRLDPVALKIVDLFVPLPNTPDGRLEASSSRTNDENQYTVRGDHQINSAHKLYGTAFLLRGKNFDPFASSTQVPDYAQVNSLLNQNTYVVSEDWIVSPTTLNQARFSLSQRISGLSTPLTTSWPDFGSKVVIGTDPPRPPQLFITGRWQMGTFGSSNFNQRAFNLSDTFTSIHGAHSIKAGVWSLLSKYIETGNWLGSGQVRFQPQFSGNVLADFLLGRAASFRQNSGTDRNFFTDSYHFFVQDDWQIARRLTLNLGLRYELNRPLRSDRDQLTAFRAGQQSAVIPGAPLGVVFPGDQDIPRGIVATDRNDWAPRIGLAYDPFGKGRTAIRAGYGIYYAIGFANWTSNLQGQPFLLDVTVFGTPNLVDPYANVPGGTPFPYKFDPARPNFSLPLSANSIDSGFRSPYVQQYSFSLEQQLGRNTAATAAYVGNNSHKLSLQRDLNQPIFGPGATAGNINSRRPYLPGTFAQIASLESAANGNYNSLQLSLNQRFAHGFTAAANYTFAKALDDITSDVTGATAVAMVDSNNRRVERGPSDSDVRHIFNLSWVYELGDFKRLGWAGRVLGGWQVNGILRVQSGSAYTVTSGKDTNLNGVANDRPDLIGNPYLDTGRSRADLIARYFDPMAFRAAAPGLIGTAGRNILYGPGAKNVTASLFKNFTLYERHKLQFRAEFFNLPNTVNMGNPNSNISAGNAGRILSADAARQVQFALKYMF